jgi:uncharacterized protein YceK
MRRILVLMLLALIAGCGLVEKQKAAPSSNDVPADSVVAESSGVAL